MTPFLRFFLPVLLLCTAICAQAELQPFVQYEGKLLPVIDCGDDACFVLQKGKRLKLYYEEIVLRPATGFADGWVEVSNIQFDLDPLKNAPPKKQKDPSSIHFRYEVDVTSTTALDDCYGLLTFVVNGSVGTKLVPIGDLKPGKAKHLKVELKHRINSVGRLHVFFKGQEVKTSQNREAYDAVQYFQTLTKAEKGVSAVALCHSADTFPHELSHDGSKLATIRKRDTHNSLIIYDLASMKLLHDIKLGNEGQTARDLTWVSDHELALIYDEPVKAQGKYTHLGLLDIRKGQIEKLEGYVERIISVMKKQPHILAVYGSRWQYKPGVAKYDLKQRRIISKESLDEGTTYFDDNGDERIRYEDDGDGYICYYKPTPASSWRRLDKDVKQQGLRFDQRGKGLLDRVCEIHSIGPDGDTLYISSRLNSDHFELAAFSLSKAEIVRTIAKSPKYDLTSDDEGYSKLLFHKSTSELLGIRVDAVKPQIIWLKSHYAAAQKLIDQAMPDHINLPLDWSDNGEALIYFSYNDRDPGSYYLLRPGEGRLVVLHSLAEHLQQAKLGHTEPLDFNARDGAVIHGYVTYPPDYSKEQPAPLIVLVHGGPMTRDAWYFNAENQFFATRGYVVLQVNYRGSSGYGAAYQKGGLYARLDTVVLDDIADGAKHLIATGAVDPQRVAVMGASFGGWATYMCLIKYPELYRAGIAISAISSWKKQIKHDRNFYWNRMSYTFWKELLSRENFAKDEPFIDPLLRAAELKRPVYIMHGEYDWVVDASEARRMLDALKKTNPDVQAMSFPYATHSTWSFADRVTKLNEIEGFLQKHLALRPKQEVAGNVSASDPK